MISQVPLDWLDPSEDARASIALIRHNATDLKNYKGSVIINPGKKIPDLLLKANKQQVGLADRVYFS